MAPANAYHSILVKRDDDYYNSAWYSWGKWVLLIIVIIVIISALLIGSTKVARNRARYRLNQGEPAPIGTAWLFRNPPAQNYNQNQQGEYPVDVAPRYNPDIGEDDAGFYDRQGNFVSKTNYQVNETEIPPPPGPPPSFNEISKEAEAHSYPTPLTPVFRSSNEVPSSDYYRPPPPRPHSLRSSMDSSTIHPVNSPNLPNEDQEPLNSSAHNTLHKNNS